MKKISLKVIALFLVVALLPACKEGNEKDDPTEDDIVIPEVVISNAQLNSTFANFTYEGMYRDYQRTTNLTHDMYAGYVANNNGGSSFLTTSPTYVHNPGWSDLRWTFFYNERTASEYGPMLKLYAQNMNVYSNVYYITRIYWAYLASTLTDTYGDVPLSAYVDGNLPEDPENVKYDTQAECYDLIFKLLEEAVANIKPGAAGQYTFKDQKLGNGSRADRCYDGDEEKWLRFANTLRLRLALRISNVDPARAKKEAEAAMSNEWGLMQSNADNFVTVPKHAPIAEGGEGEGGAENVITMCCYCYTGDIVLGKDLELYFKNQSTGGADNYFLRSTWQNVDDLNDPLDEDWAYVDSIEAERGEALDYNTIDPATWQHSMIDPRCKVMCSRPTLWDVDGIEGYKFGTEWASSDYTGCYQGDPRVLHTSTTNCFSMFATDGTNPDVLNDKKWFSKNRENVWLSYAESKFLLAEAALKGWNGTGGTAKSLYLEGIQASMDYYHISSAEASSYINGLKYASDVDAGGEKALEQIITQKWLAMAPNGTEGWAEFRRTGYPALTLPLVNNSSDVPHGEFIKRVNYPISTDGNTKRPSITQNTRVWWDVN